MLIQAVPCQRRAASPSNLWVALIITAPSLCCSRVVRIDCRMPASHSSPPAGLYLCATFATLPAPPCHCIPFRAFRPRQRSQGTPLEHLAMMAVVQFCAPNSVTGEHSILGRLPPSRHCTEGRRKLTRNLPGNKACSLVLQFQPEGQSWAGFTLQTRGLLGTEKIRRSRVKMKVRFLGEGQGRRKSVNQ